MSQKQKHAPQGQTQISLAVQATFQQGIEFHRQGKLSDAESSYREVLRQQPEHFGALHRLGVIALRNGQPEKAASLIRNAISINSNVAIAHRSLGKALLDLKRPVEALASLDKAIALKPDLAEAYNNRASAFLNLNRAAEALASCDKAIALKPDNAEAYYVRGTALNRLKRAEEALLNFDSAIALKSDLAEAHNGRGLALVELKRPGEAVASFDKATSLKSDFVEAHYNRAITLNDQKRFNEALASSNSVIELKPDFAKAYNVRGVVLSAMGRPDEALRSYNKAIALKPDYVGAYYNRAIVLSELMRHEEALASYDKALALMPDFAEAYNNRGLALSYLKRYEEAVVNYERAIALQPDFVEAYINRGVSLRDLKCPEEALASFNKAIALRPHYEFLYGLRLHTKMTICAWDNIKEEIAELTKMIKFGEVASLPFPVLSILDSPDLQRRTAEIWTEAKCPLNKTLPAIPKRLRREKLLIGYFSADFYDHATARLMAELFEKHNKNRFELIGFSLGPDKNDEIQQRLSAAFAKFINVRNRSDGEVGILARELGIDIAVDLKGFTADGRPRIFAFRAAPIQVSYLAYPGTMGVDYIDYLIADPTLIPETHRRYYAEKIAYLPNCYQANDSKRPIAEKLFTRAEVGLPDSGFVFCCFNNNYKITPDVFDRWMRILKQVDGSVLWLFEDNAAAASNLRKEAQTRGVAPGRLVFAKRMPLPDHLARHRLADLFLDTLPYNAHTTASDALWAGLPVLTQIGESFAARVAASLLTAIGLPELITSTPQAYEDLAMELATNPQKLTTIKRKLEDNRCKTPLFDAQLFTRHIEEAYTAMYERYQADLPPDHIYVLP